MYPRQTLQPGIALLSPEGKVANLLPRRHCLLPTSPARSLLELTEIIAILEPANIN